MTFTILVVSLAILAAVALALALITDALSRRREVAAAVAFPPLGQMLTVRGGKVHALVKGAGPDIVLIHGASGNLRDLLPLIDRLAPHYRVTAFDRPGLGWSDPITGGDGLAAQAEQLAEAAQQLGITAPIILGQSYGGSVALAWALHAPLKPRALVLVSAPSLPWPGHLDIWYRSTNTWAGRAVVIPLACAFVPDAHINAIITDIFTPDPEPPAYRDYVGAGLALTRRALRANCDQVNGLYAQIVSQSAHYPGLSLPVELIHGDADTIVPLHIHSQPLAALLPDANLTVLPGAGHMPHHHHPDVIIAAIQRADARSRLP